MWQTLKVSGVKEVQSQMCGRDIWALIGSDGPVLIDYRIIPIIIRNFTHIDIYRSMLMIFKIPFATCYITECMEIWKLCLLA